MCARCVWWVCVCAHGVRVLMGVRVCVCMGVWCVRVGVRCVCVGVQCVRVGVCAHVRGVCGGCVHMVCVCARVRVGVQCVCA